MEGGTLARSGGNSSSKGDAKTKTGVCVSSKKECYMHREGMD